MSNKISICPLMQKPCIEDGTPVTVDGKTEMHACRFWVHIVGKHPQTGADQDLWDCAHAWMPVLLIDNTQRQRETGAAVESFRNVLHEDMATAMNRQTLLNTREIKQIDMN